MCVIRKSDAADLLIASDLLDLIPLRKAAANFLQKCIDARNCLQVRFYCKIVFTTSRLIAIERDVDLAAKSQLNNRSFL